MVVDLGRSGDWTEVEPVLTKLPMIDLLVISHLDADHIEGAMPLAAMEAPSIAPRRVWFNSGPQFSAARKRSNGAEPFSVPQAVKLQSAIERWGWSWNDEFVDHIASVDSKPPESGVSLDDGLTIRMLSPNGRQLVSFLPKWDEAFARLKPNKEARTDEFESFGIASIDVEALARETYRRDSSLPNGTAIAYIAEFQGKRVMLAADAHSEVLVDGLRRLGATEDNPCQLDLLKVSHHGSRANTSPELLRLIDCKRFAISTNGERHDHPDRQTIARILSRPSGVKTLYFNFDQPSTQIWHQPRLKERWRYSCVFLNGQAISI